MTLLELQTKADAKLVDFWQALVPRQDAYFAKHGKYFQLIVTNSVIDGLDTIFEVRHPNDELHQVDVDFTFASPIPFQIKVDEWVGASDNIGFIVTVVVELPAGDRYTRSRNNSNVDSGWSKIIEE